MLLYHSTTIGALESILINGLLPRKPKQRDKVKGIYLTEYPFRWTFNLSLNRFPTAILTINCDGLNLVNDYHNDSRDNMDSKGDLICLEKIIPTRIRRIYVSTKEKPNAFNRVYKRFFK